MLMLMLMLLFNYRIVSIPCTPTTYTLHSAVPDDQGYQSIDERGAKRLIGLNLHNLSKLRLFRAHTLPVRTNNQKKYHA
ncbi:hypothetical protein BDZ91DRAFT_712245 [Kalaharituber pfeilii]|nr:hypothetical protein BDZ91DRAFT_712245 [Kalaharituber pfeilii]